MVPNERRLTGIVCIRLDLPSAASFLFDPVSPHVDGLTTPCVRNSDIIHFTKPLSGVFQPTGIRGSSYGIPAIVTALRSDLHAKHASGLHIGGPIAVEVNRLRRRCDQGRTHRAFSWEPSENEAD